MHKILETLARLKANLEKAARVLENICNLMGHKVRNS